MSEVLYLAATDLIRFHVNASPFFEVHSRRMCVSFIEFSLGVKFE